MKRLLMMIKYRQYRWAARLLGLLGFVFFVSYFTADGLADIKIHQPSSDLTLILIFVLLCFTGYLLGWVIEIAGGILLTISAILLSFYLHYFVNFSIITSIIYYGLPFFIPGILFITAWRIKILRKSELPC
ncbi:MAG: hypothetical protein EOM06_03275 [Sphingobacteriia bacterium]|nr:hypothetical protein [Sphingobacteriia bacterium]